MLRFLGLLFIGWVALVIVLWVLSFVVGLILEVFFWISLLGFVVLAVIALAKRRR